MLKIAGRSVLCPKAQNMCMKQETQAESMFIIAIEAKKEKDWSMEPYPQVFEERHGFIPNLSILDLLFNEGTNALDYLKDFPLDLQHA